MAESRQRQLKKTAKPKWTRATKPKRKTKSKVWWVSLDKQCKPGCDIYAPGSDIEFCLTKPRLDRIECGCVLLIPAGDRISMSLAQYRARFANAPKLVPGARPRKVRLRMEVA